jgi:hypothetical protein
VGWVGVFGWLVGWFVDWRFRRRVGGCFERLKVEQFFIGRTRFYLVAKCVELAGLSDWEYSVFLFHYHETTVDFDDHLVIRFLRWLQS